MNYRTALLLLLFCFSARAEYRQWTHHNGATVDAEYVKLMGRTVYVRDKEGSVRKLAELHMLSEEDQRYVQLMNPPELDLSIKKINVKRSSSRYSEKGGATVPLKDSDLSEGMIAYEVISATYDCAVEVKRNDRRQYDRPLHLQIYWISRRALPLEEQKKQKKRYETVISHFESREFYPNTITSRQPWACSSKPIIIKGKSQLRVVKQQSPDDVNNILDEIRYTFIRTPVSGYEFYRGILVVVADERGKVLALDSNWYQIKNDYKKIIGLKEGDALEGNEW